MIVDTSALVAIITDEPERDAFVAALVGDAHPRISAATLLETHIVIDSRRSPVASRRVDDLVARLGLVVEPVTAEQGAIARAAYRDYGRGSGHPARLDFGDCFAYALARATGDPILFKGDDFGRTDLTPAVPAG
ncbi:MAG: type II toxin-antitoxin system VapC family toxin [Micrococcales bacterium]|nr:type II toxin-antitoxin system VapC family toxin [Micrococcales bacterium]